MCRGAESLFGPQPTGQGYGGQNDGCPQPWGWDTFKEGGPLRFVGTPGMGDPSGMEGSSGVGNPNNGGALGVRGPLWDGGPLRKGRILWDGGPLRDGRLLQVGSSQTNHLELMPPPAGSLTASASAPEGQTLAGGGQVDISLPPRLGPHPTPGSDDM